MEALQKRCTVSGTVRFILFISSLAGIAPLKFEKVHNGWRIQISRVVDLYGKILVISLSILVGVDALGMMITNSVSYFGSKVDFVAIITTVIPSIIGALLASFTARKRMRFIIHNLAQLEKINKQLYQINNCEKVEYKEWYKLIGVSSLMFSSVFIYLTQYVVFIKLEKSLGVFFETLSFFYFILYQYIQLISVQFFAIISSVLLTFKHFNVSLKLMLKRIGEDKGLDRQQRRTPATIHRLTFLYCSLCDVMQSLNENYGVLLAHHVFVMFLNLTADYYILFIMLFSDDLGVYKNHVPIYLVIFLTSCSVSINMINLIIVAEPCHRIQAEIKDTKITLSKLLRAVSPSQYEINSELLLFYRHLMMFDVNISPLKMFTLNRSLITKVMASIVSYVVILLSF